MGGGAMATNSGYPIKRGMDPLLKIVLLSSAGSVLEWMDFSVYAFLALEIGRAFFPAGDATVHLLETFSIHAVAFVVRPLGGLLFGHIGDVYGKKLALQLSLLLMALATTLMGTLPTYERIGLAAPCLLAVFRMLQGLAVGGQLVGTMVYIDHHAPGGHKGYYGGVTLAGGALGVLLGSLEGALIVAVCTPQQLRTFGFRIPFLMGFLVAVAGLALHKQAPEVEEPAKETVDKADRYREEHPHVERLSGPTGGAENPITAEVKWGREDSTEDQSAPIVGPKEKEGGGGAEGREGRRQRGGSRGRGGGTQPSPLVSLLRHHKGELFLAFLVATLWCTAFYIMYVWISSFLSHLTHPPVKNALFINSFWLLVLTLALPYGGHLADKHGVHRMMLLGAVYILVASPVCFYIFQRGAHRGAAAFFGQALFTPGLVVAGGPLTAYLTGHATTSRATYTAVALIYNLAQATFGGTALLVATALADSAYGLGAGLWLSFTALLCIVALLIDRRAQTGCNRRLEELADAEKAVARV